MKYLTHYTEEAVTELLRKTGAFFAFGNAQFEEKQVEGVTYCSLGAGMICPRDNAQELVDGLENITLAGIQKDLEENGRAAVIRRELFNHECFYVGSIEGAVDALAPYGISEQEVKTIYSHILSTEDNLF